VIRDGDYAKTHAKETGLLSTPRESDISASAIEGLHPTYEIPKAEHHFQIKFIEQHNMTPKDNSGSLQSEQDEHLRPITHDNVNQKLLGTTEANETTVIIKIGRIEVKAIAPVGSSAPRKVYSPPLSLADYLKRRKDEAS
jgi:hypothetical protein